jgi:hypothetical protein
MHPHRFGLLALALAAPLAAYAQAAPDAAPTPAAAPAEQPICADRPTKSNNACTVDPGHFQLEADIANATFFRLDGVSVDTWLIANPTLKYGLAPNLDIEVNIAPVEIVRTRIDGAATQTIAGVSDLFLKAKYQFLNTKDGVWQAALLPYVKIPTARAGIGNGAVEGGLLLPLSYKINNTFSLSAQPEYDDLLNAAGAGHHANYAQTLSLSASLPHTITLYGELAGDWNFDRSGEVTQYSADLALSFNAGPRLQFDGGVNIGLNRFTPGAQVYIGVSQKF